MTRGKAQPIKDLAKPRIPLPFRAVNFFGSSLAARFISLDEENLLATARKNTRLDNYEDESFREPMRVFLNALEKEANLSAVGRFLSRNFILQLLSNRLILHDLLTRHPEILEERIEKPVIVAGLPRTGTTHLHNLLSQDPALRYMPYWESLEPFLPPDKQGEPSEQDPRVKRCERALKFMNYVMPLFSSMHEMTADGPHEEMQLLSIHFSAMLFENMYFIPSYRDWYKESDHTGAYACMRLALQAMQWQDGSPKRWVLKSPQHLEQFRPLLSVFPDAMIVQTHRDPVRITASVCIMIAYSQRMNAAAVDPLTIGRYWADRAEDLLHASVDDRHLLQENHVINVRFHDYIAN